jgi:hypothetical protein
MRGFSSRLRFLAASRWCRNDIGQPPPVGIPIFGATTHGTPTSIRVNKVCPDNGVGPVQWSDGTR